MNPNDRAPVVIVPAFEDSAAVRILLGEIKRVLGDEVFVVVVDDGSVVAPPSPSDLRAAGAACALLQLGRNVGHQRALAVGLAYAVNRFPGGRPFILMDADGEDRPESIPELLAALAQGNVDIAVAERRKRWESMTFRAAYLVYRAVFGLLTGRRIRFGNFMAMTSGAARRMASMGELAIHVAGCVLLSRLRWVAVPIDRGARYAGQSRMNFVSLALHGFRGLMVFAEDVLVRVGAACAAVAATSLIGISAAVVLKAVGYATPGWFSVALGILLLMFLQTGAITLMTLLLTGVARNSVLIPADYRSLLAVELEVTSVESFQSRQ
jgi:polyisoprenyl-phosphate glycosyltransferase